MLQQLDFWLSVFVLGLLFWAKFGGRIQAALAKLRPETVNNYQEEPPPIMSRTEDEPSRTNERTERTNERSSHDQLWEDFLLDRTRGRLIAVMVDSDLTVTEIRALLKGESTALGQEIEAIKKKLGKAPAQTYRTPIAGRPTDARYYQDEPELEYQAPPN